MSDGTVQFAVIYRWRLHAGQEAAFAQAWETVTRGIIARRGGLGSRLHQTDDGTWVAYAQWPNRETWARSQSQPSVDAEASNAMRAAIAESFDAVPLALERDALVV